MKNRSVVYASCLMLFLALLSGCIGEAEGYQFVPLPDAGLTLEVPANWERQADASVWLLDGGAATPRIGVHWEDLQPPLEAEAMLLPHGAQIVDSEPVELAWGTGRSFTLEVYAPFASEDDVEAEVATVERHFIIVAEHEGERRAYDFYAIATSYEQLDSVGPIYRHLLTSSRATTY